MAATRTPPAAKRDGAEQAPTPPMEPPTHGTARRCKAKSSRTGQPCKRYAIQGGVVCPHHGGSAGQVVEAARRRLREALDPAAAELVRIAKGGKRESDRLRAIEGIMDRAGLPAGGDQNAAMGDILVRVSFAKQGRKPADPEEEAA